MQFWTILTLTVIGGVSAAPTLKSDDFSLVILHNNDMHGRFEETETNTGTCNANNRNKTCIGGMARTAHVIRAYKQRAEQGTGPPALYLNAGDTFVGTAWFSLFTWNITSAFLNMLKPDAMSLGNHEFDLTPATLSTFLDHVPTIPTLACNLNFTNEPSLMSKVNKSIILTVAGTRIGIIGYLTPETILISSTGKVEFSSEVAAITQEALSLDSQGVKIIIALGHSGYSMDQTIAKEVELVDVVIGGHTNTFLWNGDQPDTEPIEDPYPKVVVQQSGKRVPVVQAFAYTKYLGVLNLTFNANGDLTQFAGQPILMESSIPQEPDVLQLLEVYRPAIDQLNLDVVGQSIVFLDGDNVRCRSRECNLGNLVTDALVSYATTESTDKWTNVPIGICNGGGIRNSITPEPTSGNITRGDIVAVLPYNNQVIVLTLKGSDLLYSLEQMVRSQGETSSGEFPQVSGLRLVLDMTRAPYSRVVSLEARCGVCDIPKYEAVDPDKNYTLVTSSFLADGGDGITTFRDKFLDRKILDMSDADVLVRYFNIYSPVYPELQGRITIVQSEGSFGSKVAVSWVVMIVVVVGKLLM